MDDAEEMLYVYPEQFSKDTLLRKLQQYGMDTSLLQKLEGNIHELVKCFYENVAALPRRKARDNRRGKMLKKIHEIEDKMAASKLHAHKKFTPASSVRSTTSTRGYQTPFQSNSVVNSTPELDRLEARSKAAKQLKSNKNSTSEMDRLEARSKAVKQSKSPESQSPESKSPESQSVTAPKRIKLAASKDSDAKLLNTVPAQNSLAKSSHLLTTKITSPSRADQTNSNSTVESSADIREKTNLPDSSKVAKRKLKRNSFTPGSEPVSKLGKC